MKYRYIGQINAREMTKYEFLDLTKSLYFKVFTKDKKGYFVEYGNRTLNKKGFFCFVEWVSEEDFIKNFKELK